MSRPAVSVVMPFAGDGAARAQALEALSSLEIRPGDELILAENSGTAPAPVPASRRDGVAVVVAAGERSPAHARNVGAEHAHADWILFIDADCRPSTGLLGAYFAAPVADDVGALAGEVVPAAEAATLAARYGAARSFLSQEAHLAHAYLPRAVAANLMVRRAAFEEVGGFYEGVRAAEDTDFSWRLQQAGWRLELRPGATVEHRYRSTLRELRSQWRGYAAGRAWLRRRYAGFVPESSLRRALIRGLRAVRGKGRAVPGEAGHRRIPRRTHAPLDARPGRLERGGYLALDTLLAVEELAGLALSNRPTPRRPLSDAQVVLIADRFPVRGDPLVDFARTLHGARIEANSRPQLPWAEVTRELDVSYREDDGAAARCLSLLRLLVRHPVRCALDLARRRAGEPRLSALAPAALRLERQRGARVHPVGGEDVQTTARRLASLAGRGVEKPRRS